MATHTDDTEKNQNEDENFGLPDLEYKPLDQLEEQKTTHEETPVAEEESVTHEESQEESTDEQHEESDHEETEEYDNEESPSRAPVVVLSIIIILVLAIGGYMIYRFVYLPKQEKARQEALAKQKADADKKAEEERQAKLAQEEQERLKREAEAKAKPAEGSIETLAQRSGKYYIIVSSSVDGDLAMDRAKKLSAKGVNSKIIPPYGKWKYYRLGIGDYDSFASAQSAADAAKGEYGDGLWVMKF